MLVLLAPLLLVVQGCGQPLDPGLSEKNGSNRNNTGNGPAGGESPLGGSEPPNTGGGGGTLPPVGGGGGSDGGSNYTPTITPELKAAYRSLHQFNLRVARPPAPGSFEYTFSNLVGFQSQYNPNDAVAGCAIGAIANTQCAFPWTEAGTVALNFTEALIGYNVPGSMRFFVTSGASDIRMTGYAAQKTAFVFAMRMGRAPARTASVSAAEYASIQMSEKVDTSFSRLASGQEILVTHDGGGTLRFLSGRANTSGGWIFIKQIPVASAPNGLVPSPTLYDIQLAVVSDKSAFLSHYKNLKWDSSGDPQ